ncbi:MAG: beta-lactamase family protein [bacterium]|nr:beta-lactamase family protein [bacterium]
MVISRKLILIAVMALILTVSLQVHVLAQSDESAELLSQFESSHIETFIKKQMKEGQIPGMAVVIVKGNQVVYKKGFGFSNRTKKELVTAGTVFELGSNSKAYTGLGILLLESKGLLYLDDPVEKYIPWFKMKYKGKDVSIKLSHLLYHTSGIPYYEALCRIPPSEKDNALDEAVRSFAGMELSFSPGARFSYSTVNYDVLGLVIQKVSALSFEEYMKRNVLIPLGLNNTYLFDKDAKGKAAGYKIFFKKAAAYDAPMYRGNTPAGYFMSDINDQIRWLKIQMGTVEVPGFEKIIEKSHIADPGLEGSNYAAGWFIFNHLGYILHSAANPTFSSFIGYTPHRKIGVAVLANISSRFTAGTGRGLLAVMNGTEPKGTSRDMNTGFDNLAVNAIYVISPLFLLALILLVRSISKIAGKKKSFHSRGIIGVVVFIFATLLVAASGYLLSILPSLLKFNVNWSFGKVWTPLTFYYAVLGLFFMVFSYYLLFLSAFFFPKVKKAA